MIIEGLKGLFVESEKVESVKCKVESDKVIKCKVESEKVKS